MYATKIFSLIALEAILESSVVVLSVIARNEQIPSIKFIENPEYIGDWRNISIPSTQRNAVYIEETETIFSVECIAPYPIQWKFTGQISQNDWEILPTYDVEENHVIQAKLEDFVNFASVRVACEKVANSSIMDEIYIFVNPLTNGTLIKKVDTVTNSQVLPCLTLDPMQDVQLYIKTSDEKIKSVVGHGEDFRYNPVEGFWSENIFDGDYICQQNYSSTVAITAITTTLKDYMFLPQSNDISVFSESTIRFECISKVGKNVQIIIDEDTTSFYDFTGTFAFGGIREDFLEYNISESVHRNLIARNHDTLDLYYSIRDSTVEVEGTVSCVTNSSSYDEQIVLKKWSYKFVQTPAIRFENYARQIQCLSPSESVELKTAPCRNSFECGFMMTHCQKNVIRCNFDTIGRYGNRIGCLGTDQRFQWGCVSGKYTHHHGLVQCKVAGLEKWWNFFESLDQRKYINWEVVPIRELIRLDETAHILYTNESTRFICEASYHLFTDLLKFNIVFLNQSIMRVDDNYDTGNVSIADGSNPRLIRYVNSIGILDIKLPLYAVGVQCVGAFWNSTDEVVTERRFETRHLYHPELASGYDGTKIHQTLFTDEINQRLTCPGTGEPRVNYTWLYNNSTVSNVFLDLKTNLGSNGESYLEFPRIQKLNVEKYAGEYKCVVMNRLGSVEQNFEVNVSDKPASGNIVVYSFTAAIAAVLVAILLITLLIYIRRYKIAKKMLRDLTDAELEEFFHGRQELVGNTANAETVEFQPYNKDYEIRFNDLEFTSSGNNVLGSGEFAFVVRGLVKSQGKPVALKIPKPSTDVTIFKSLLSEVKIMIYIGSHENVVCLIGACTEEIKNRQIYIATEICDGGCLSKFLLKSRSAFVNMMTANQEIDAGTVNEYSSNQVTTLDLVSFASQIANGMEYLSYKNIIHADLAARNILLTDNNIAKITDFGLSKKLYESGNYVKKSRTPLPWRWMALESLKTMTFSTSSDVWAYGVTLFEIFSLGEIPFPNETWSESFVDRLSSGMRMGRPKFATQEIYSKIIACWEEDPEIRPGFGTLRGFFQELLSFHCVKPNIKQEERLVPQENTEYLYIDA